MPPEEYQPPSSDNFEMESQFILRLPHLPAASLKAAVKSGVQNLKDRLSIQLEPDIRNGKVRFDGWVLPAKIVDLPTIIESHKTLDSKNFYKTADICQMMVCKEEEEDNEPPPDEAEEIKKTKDGKDKRYLYPHGITKPLKNVRKKRFRKMLRKKYVDFPEIEKEVKRLLRTDNEAKYVRYEIVNVEDEKALMNQSDSKDGHGHGHHHHHHLNASSSSGVMNSEYDEGDLFGGGISDSDDDNDDDDFLLRGPVDTDEGSRLSATGDASSTGYTGKDYLKDDVDSSRQNSFSFERILSHQQQPSTSTSSNLANFSSSLAADQSDSLMESEGVEAASGLEAGVENESIRAMVDDLEREILLLQRQRLQQQLELDGIENIALKQRFQAIIDDLQAQEQAKAEELSELKGRLVN